MEKLIYGKEASVATIEWLAGLGFEFVVEDGEIVDVLLAGR